MDKLNIYDEIALRTKGNIYIGVVGPVRTGKSTFIKRFMDIMVLPKVDDEFTKARLVDQMPQSGDGNAVYTTEPKFIPEEGVALKTKDNISFNVKMIDCVGYMVLGADSGETNGKERMVKTPWSDKQMSFSDASRIGTDKVINEHATIATLVFTDGTITDMDPQNYINAERECIEQIKHNKKPFVVIVNSSNPSGVLAAKKIEQIQREYGVKAMAVNCMKMSEKDIELILTMTLASFSPTEITFQLPGYVDALEPEHWIKKSIIDSIFNWMDSFETIEELKISISDLEENQLIQSIEIKDIDMARGIVSVEIALDEQLYYKVIEDIMGKTVDNENTFFCLLKEFAQAKKSYDILKNAMEEVEQKGYGIVRPALDSMTLDEPEVFKQGNKFGVRLKAKAPCLHIIKTDISTEVSPIVGSQSQSEDLAKFLNTQFVEDKNAIWETNLFGKSIQSMVTEQIDSKVQGVPEALRNKVQKSLQKISDEGKDYYICIII